MACLLRQVQLAWSDGGEMLVQALGEVDHHVLGVLRQLADFLGRGPTEPREGRHHGLWRHDGAVLDHAAVLQHAPAALQYKENLFYTAALLSPVLDGCDQVLSLVLPFNSKQHQKLVFLLKNGRIRNATCAIPTHL